MKTFKIENSENIIDFISFIYDSKKDIFDPAENIAELKDDNGHLIFGYKEGNYYETVMNECFLYCVFNKMNIDKLAESVFSVRHINIAA